MRSYIDPFSSSLFVLFAELPKAGTVEYIEKLLPITACNDMRAAA